MIVFCYLRKWTVILGCIGIDLCASDFVVWVFMRVLCWWGEGDDSLWVCFELWMKGLLGFVVVWVCYVDVFSLVTLRVCLLLNFACGMLGGVLLNLLVLFCGY